MYIIDEDNEVIVELSDIGIAENPDGRFDLVHKHRVILAEYTTLERAREEIAAIGRAVYNKHDLYKISTENDLGSSHVKYCNACADRNICESMLFTGDETLYATTCPMWRNKKEIGK
jgi:hypothetical protein